MFPRFTENSGLYLLLTPPPLPVSLSLSSSRVSCLYQVKHCDPLPSNPVWSQLPKPRHPLPLPHGGATARPLTATGCPGLHGARTPLAPPAAPTPGEREGLGWRQHRRGPLGVLPAPGDGDSGRRGGRW